MANTFKNSIKGPAGTSGLSVYSCPAATSATVIGVNVANTLTPSTLYEPPCKSIEPETFIEPLDTNTNSVVLSFSYPI